MPGGISPQTGVSQTSVTAVSSVGSAGVTIVPETGYEGPLDIVAGAVVAYGQRALSAAKRGTALYTIKRKTDDATQSFSSDATTGAAPSSEITAFIVNGGAATFNQTGATVNGVNDITLVSATGVIVGMPISGTGIPAGALVAFISGLVITVNPAPTATNAAVTLTFSYFGIQSTWNDQGADGKNASEPVAYRGPTWYTSQVNGVPAARFNTSNVEGGTALKTASNVTFPNGKITWFAVLKLSVAGSLFGQNYRAANNFSNASVSNTDITTYINDAEGDQAGATGTDDTTLTNAFYLIEVACEFGSRSVRINGVDKNATSGDAGAAPVGAVAQLLILGDDDPVPQSPIEAYVAELLIYASILTSQQRSNIRTNIATYYGITLS